VGDAVGKLLGDGALAASMGKAGRAWVETEHTWARSADQLANWLREAVGSDLRGSPPGAR